MGLGFSARRLQAFSQLEDPEALRRLARALKERSLENLPMLLEILESRVVEAGGVVHWARSAEDARRIVVELARERGVRRIVKGKSMVSEEISLNEHLIREGFEVWETDLGEFIVQMAGEPPSHIVGPAVHKSKEEIAELFEEKLGVEKAQTPEELTAIARKALREKFLSADMGITGVNIAVAETGSIVLLENEGNIRLSTTVPKIHVALMGIEKVVPTLEDMALLLVLLARSCTGQKQSTYTSILTGPRQEGERDGPEEFHLILLDNGRTRILADSDRRETLYCIRCGACLNVCPVYQRVGGHSYGWVYSGPIGAILTPQLIAPRLARDLPFASTLCGACAEVCPVMINHPKILLHLRWKMTEDPFWDAGISPLRRGLLSLYGWVASKPGLYNAASRLARLLQPLVAPSGKWRVLPPLLARWGRNRVIPVLAEPFSRRWPAIQRQLKGGKGGP
jgi:L-lactate dehydrogenase complex protein LldF